MQEKDLYLEITKNAKEFIIENGYDPIYGARPLKRYIQSTVETMLAKQIISSNLEPFSTIIVDEVLGELKINVKK